MDDKINAELALMQDELMKLDSAIQQINKAGALSTEVVTSVQGVQQSYASHLQNVQDYYQQTVDKAYATYQADIDKVSSILASYQKQIDEVQVLINSYLDLAQHTAKLADQITQVDFPTRFTSLESTIKGMSAEFENIQAITLSVEQNLKIENATLARKQKSHGLMLNIMLVVGALTLIGIILTAFHIIK